LAFIHNFQVWMVCVCVKTRNLTLRKDTAVSDNEQMTIPTEVKRNLYQMSG